MTILQKPTRRENRSLSKSWVKSQLEPPEHISGEQQKECDQQRLEAVIAHHGDRDVRIAHKERENCQQH
jgi:hypothetical protein